jgi:Putative Flp pilus-assembly TadE/G-like
MGRGAMGRGAMRQRGAASLPLLGVCVLALSLALVVADVGLLLEAKARAGTAADAAALAAAPVTFRPFGAAGTPAQEAARFAGLNGARLVACACRVDETWRRRSVEIVVEADRSLILFGEVTVRARSRAEFDPSRLVTRRAGP